MHLTDADLPNYDEDEGYDAADHGPVLIDPAEERRLFLEACARAAEAGL